MNFNIKTITSPEINAMLSIRPTYRIIPRYGQRLYGPPIGDLLSEPEEGSEVYVSGIPTDCYEDELVPVFESVGHIYQLRLMVNFSGLNRGFAFVKYTNPFDAQNAIQTLNAFHIRPQNRIKVVSSNDNRRLVIGNIPRNVNELEIWNQLNCVTNGLKSVFTKRDGLALIEYESHHSASMARRLFASGFKLWNNRIEFQWFDPRIQSKSIRSLCVRRMNHPFEEQWIKSLFSCLNTYGPQRLNVQNVRIDNDLAFVRFATREEAEIALNYFTKVNKNYGFQICWDQRSHQ